MNEELHVLIAEDLPTDAELCEREVEKVLGSCRFRRVETGEDYLAALEEFQPDLILCDYKMPRFDGMTALKLAQERAPGIPFILVTGSINEEVAVECMKAGAWDYVIKDRIKRLGLAVLGALDEKRLRLEKQRAAEDLIERDIRFSKLSAQVPGMIYQFLRKPDGSYCVPFTTNAIRQMFMCSPQDVRDDFSPIARMILPKDLGRVIDSIEYSSSHMTDWQCEYRVQVPGQPVKWFHGWSAPEKLEDGSVIWHGFNTDITVHKQAEDARLTNQKRIEALLNLFQLDLTSEDEVIRATVEELINLTDSHLGFLGFVDDTETIMNGHLWSEKAMERCAIDSKCDQFSINEGGLWTAAVREHKPIIINDYLEPHPWKKGYPAGHAPISRYVGIPVIHDGRSVMVCGLANKVEEYTETDVQQSTLLLQGVWSIISRMRVEEMLQRSEENFRGSLDNSPLGIRIVTAEGKTIYINRALLDIYGYDSLEEYNNTTGKKSYTPESYAEHRERVEKRQRGEYVPSNYEISIVRKDGGIGHLEVFRKEVLWNSKPQFQMLYRDITERKQAEEEHLRLQKLESVGTLAAGIAHDFNNLLTGILGNISLATMKSRSGDDIADILEEAEKASLRAKDLTQQLLTFARGGTPVKKLVSLRDMIKDTSDFALRGSSVKCSFHIPEDLWNTEVDEGQISQVISNLVINARQAMPAGGTIDIHAENMTLTKEQNLGKLLPLKQGDYIRIMIKDQGIGIPAKHLDRIFDPYFTTKQAGSGLGLATSYSIIRNHDGHISVESKLNEGSTFYVYLSASKKKTRPAGKEDEKTLSGKTGRILVMDDEPTVRSVAGHMLKYAGYEDAIFAVDGKEAIKLYSEAMQAEKPFDVVILDLTIPGGMGGKETLKKLLEIDPQVKAIVSSGYADETVMAEYSEYGFKGVIAKPYTLEQLEKTLYEVINEC